ncbi:hypothetical protein BDF20DRAFT_879198 [Mycotypha africana]|uniref:uncharacterized protein n=1 Tax=Mycotypha africana TaxID=64632 RepID=UPI0022FFD70B|nr:uncharacterized protein BDF20DRAFT_879198 [Mycotypha africana]KAI8975528.1 hypothetical protein BDF20DRAFT_879198 [Mycotypha africana]
MSAAGTSSPNTPTTTNTSATTTTSILPSSTSTESLHYEDDAAVSQNESQPNSSSSPQQDDELILRALVTTKEAGVIIGKGGKNVAELRETTHVKAGVSKVIQGVHDRVLSVCGTLEGVAKAYAFIARTVLENPIPGTTTSSSTTNIPNSAAATAAADINSTEQPTITLRLLISHNLMGTVIGRQGTKIKHIQDTSGARMTASKTLLPQSTERVVEVRGTVEALEQAILEIGRCLLEDKDRAYGAILYNPTKAMNTMANDLMMTTTTAAGNNSNTYNNSSKRSSFMRTGRGTDFSNNSNSNNYSSAAYNNGYSNNNNNGNNNKPHSNSYQQRRRSYNSSNNNNANRFLQHSNDPNIRTQCISIPSDMVGCIIGKGGAKISEIRKLSGSQISIAKVPHDETGERMFTIQGTAEANERALYLLYGQLEAEKERRLKGVLQDDENDFAVDEGQK